MQQERGLLSQIRFSQGMSLWQATARGLGVVVPVAVLVLLGDSIAAAGYLTPLAVGLVALLMIINGLGYAELAVNVRRAGGAYALVHEGTAGDWLEFLTGWVLALSGLGLSALLAQSVAGRLLLLAQQFALSVTPGVLAMGVIALVALAIGWVRRWGRRIPFTLPLLILLVMLVLFALPHAQAVDRGVVRVQIGPAITLLMAAFVGLEIIAGHQREIRRRLVNFPRIWLVVPALVAALAAGIAAVVVGVLGPQAAATAIAPLALVSGTIAGPTGWLVTLILETVFLVLATGRALTMVVRHLYVMSRDGFLPAWLHKSHPRREGPVRLMLLVGLLVLPAVWVPIDALARVSGLLYLLTLMAVNLTLLRRPRQDTPSTFALPFHPWIPALVLAIDVLVVPLWGLMPVIWTAVSLALGSIVYLAYGRSRHLQAQEGVTVFRPPDEERIEAAFRVLVPIANPDTAGALLRMASGLARSQEGEILALQVVVVPDPLPLEAGRRRAQAGRALLEKALALASEKGWPVQTMTRVARSVAQGILEAAVEEKADLILLGWQGILRARGASMGPVIDSVLRDAPCDVLVMRGTGGTELPRKVLIPTSGSPHAQAAARLATLLAEGSDAELTLFCVQPEQTTLQRAEEVTCHLDETAARLALDRPPKTRVIAAPSVVEGIVREAQSHDMVLLGVSDESFFDRFVFGSIPLQVAARVPTTALVQGHRGLTGIWTRRLVRMIRDALPALSSGEQFELQRELSKGAQPETNYFVRIVLSCIIAALGLLLDNPAVVIGAMLVGPLMSPIMAFSLGLVEGDLRLIRFSIEAIFKGVALVLVISVFIGILSPLKTITEEMHAYAQPTLLDLLVALVSGLAGAYALSRKDVSAALPGVAVAASLTPALATAGLGLSLGNPAVMGGAFLLFAANISAIGLAGVIIFLVLGIRPQVWGPESRRLLQQRLVASLLLLLVIAIPLGIIMGRVVRDTSQEQVVREALAQQVLSLDGELTALELNREGTSLMVMAMVHSAQPFDQQTVDSWAGMLSEQLDLPVRLEVITLPVIRSGEN